MGKRDLKEFKDFQGLDLRGAEESTPGNASREAENVVVTTSRTLETRPPLRKVFDLEAASKGLYAAGGRLRAAMKWTTDAAGDDMPGVITYDLLRGGRITNGTAVFEGVSDVTTWKGRPYIVVRLTDLGETLYEHHLVADNPYTPVNLTLTNGSDVAPGLPAPRSGGYPYRIIGVGSEFLPFYSCVAANQLDNNWTGTTGPYTAITYDIADTFVSTPFQAGPAVVTAATKVFASEFGLNRVWFSATDDPRDWTSLDDAGFLPTSTHLDGDQPINGLLGYRGQMLVMATRAIQVWNVDPDPERMSLASNIGGSGCEFPRSIANVGGDVFLFATGQFRSVSAVITTGQPKDTDIGARIRPLTQAIRQGNGEIVAAWWPELQAYVAFNGATAYCFTYSPDTGVTAWTTWALPFPVSHAVPFEGLLYVRRSDVPEVWAFDPAQQTTTDETPAWKVRFGWDMLDDTDRIKMLSKVSIPQEGTSSFRLYYSPRDLTQYEDWFTLEGSSTGLGHLMVPSLTDTVAVQFSGTGWWRLGGFVIYYEQGNIA